MLLTSSKEGGCQSRLTWACVYEGGALDTSVSDSRQQAHELDLKVDQYRQMVANAQPGPEQGKYVRSTCNLKGAKIAGFKQASCQALWLLAFNHSGRSGDVGDVVSAARMRCICSNSPRSFCRGRAFRRACPEGN